MRIHPVLLALVPLAGLAIVSACHKDDGTTPNPNTPATEPSASPPGPMEKAGAKTDEAAADAKKKTGEAASAAGTSMSKADEKLKGMSDP